MEILDLNDIGRLNYELDCINQTLEWARSFLAKPHPHLGRSGSVCPFMPYTLTLNTLYLSIIRTQNFDSSKIERQIEGYRDVFMRLEPRTGEEVIFKTILLIFPDIKERREAICLVDDLQQKLKPSFVSKGLMIGEFHPWNNSPGLRNPSFFAQRSPKPMLAIRHMVEGDLPFLNRTDDEPALRVQYLQAYVDRMSSTEQTSKHLDMARKALIAASAEYNGRSLDNCGSPAPEKLHLGDIQSNGKCPVRNVIRTGLSWLKPIHIFKKVFQKH